MRQLLDIETVFFIDMKIYIIWEMTSKLINLHQQNWMWSNLDDCSLKKNGILKLMSYRLIMGVPLKTNNDFSWVSKWQLQYLDFDTLHLNVLYPTVYPKYMHTVFALLCFVVVIHWLIFPYPSGLLHWHCGNLTIAPVPAKQPWWIWINTSCEFIMNDCITTTKQSTTKPCAYFLGYTVYPIPRYLPFRQRTFACHVQLKPMAGGKWNNLDEIRCHYEFIIFFI